MKIFQTSLAIFFLFTFASASTSGFMAGMSYAGFWNDVFLSSESDAAIDSMAANNVKWLAICVWWYQDYDTSSTFSPNEWDTPTDSSLAHIIEYAEDKGFSIMLKPMVDISDGTWRAFISPNDWELWFATYRSFMRHYASLAESLGVPWLCIGCELISSSTNRSSNWLSVVDTVRTVFSGQITYAANYFGEYDRIGWWSALDAVGIDAYYPLSDHDNPTLAELVAAWEEHISEIDTFLDTTGLDIPVIFTEIGCGSYTGANRHPWNYDFTGAEPNQEEQQNFYQAFFDTVYPESWMGGIFWWWWDNLSTGDYRWGGVEYAVGFTPNGKLAQTVLRERYEEITALKSSRKTKPQITLITSPNPFSHRCVVTLAAPKNIIQKKCYAKIFDITGKNIAQFDNNDLFIWTPDETVKNGIYIVRFFDGSKFHTKNIFLMR